MFFINYFYVTYRNIPKYRGNIARRNIAINESLSIFIIFILENCKFIVYTKKHYIVVCTYFVI